MRKGHIFCKKKKVVSPSPHLAQIENFEEFFLQENDFPGQAVNFCQQRVKCFLKDMHLRINLRYILSPLSASCDSSDLYLRSGTEIKASTI